MSIISEDQISGASEVVPETTADSAERQLLKAVNRLLVQALVCESESEVAQTCLEIAQDLTGSELGFVCEVNETGRFGTTARSYNIWKVCQIEESRAAQMMKDMEIHGLWENVIESGKPLIVSDLVAPTPRVGVLRGHSGTKSFLGVPIRRGEDMFGMIALMNKNEGYSNQDLKAVEVLSMTFLEVFSRKRAEIELMQHLKVIEKLVDENTYDLRKRVKERYRQRQVSQAPAIDSLSIPEAILRLVDLIRPSWQYPESTCARITVNDETYLSPNFAE